MYMHNSNLSKGNWSTTEQDFFVFLLSWNNVCLLKETGLTYVQNLVAQIIPDKIFYTNFSVIIDHNFWKGD